jgi:anti-anti-sigma regulatory factor/HAMP domain-containing protein
MFFRIRTRLLVANALTLVLLIALTLLVVVQLRSLGPAIALLNQLSTIAVKARDLTIAAQYASADLNAALTGVSRDQQEAQDFDRQMTLLGRAVADMQSDFDAIPLSDNFHQEYAAVQQTQGEYQQLADKLFAAVAARHAQPSVETRTAQEQAVEPASRVSARFNQQVEALTSAVAGEVAAARQGLQAQVNRTIAILVGMGLLIALVIMAIQFMTLRVVGRPLSVLAEAVRRIGAGDLSVRVPVRQKDEVGELANTFNLMAEAVLRGREELQEQNRRLEEVVQARTAVLQETVSRLEGALAEQTTLRTILEGVSTPVLPVAEGVLLMPLIGALDDQRAAQALQVLLQTVEAQGAGIVILDVTGLPLIDMAVAATLLRAAQAVRLLGASVILAGIRPEVAQTLIALDMRLDLLLPVANLQAAVALALRRSRKEIDHAKIAAESG